MTSKNELQLIATTLKSNGIKVWFIPSKLGLRTNASISQTRQALTSFQGQCKIQSNTSYSKGAINEFATLVKIIDVTSVTESVQS